MGRNNWNNIISWRFNKTKRWFLPDRGMRVGVNLKTLFINFDNEVSKAPISHPEFTRCWGTRNGLKAELLPPSIFVTKLNPKKNDWKLSTPPSTRWGTFTWDLQKYDGNCETFLGINYPLSWMPPLRLCTFGGMFLFSCPRTFYLTSGVFKCRREDFMIRISLFIFKVLIRCLTHKT